MRARTRPPLCPSARLLTTTRVQRADTFTRVRVWASCARVCERSGELRGCGQSDALPWTREGPDPTGIVPGEGILTPHPVGRRDREPVNYWNIDATGH